MGTWRMHEKKTNATQLILLHSRYRRGALVDPIAPSSRRLRALAPAEFYVVFLSIFFARSCRTLMFLTQTRRHVHR